MRHLHRSIRIIKRFHICSDRAYISTRIIFLNLRLTLDFFPDLSSIQIHFISFFQVGFQLDPRIHVFEQFHHFGLLTSGPYVLFHLFHRFICGQFTVSIILLNYSLYLSSRLDDIVKPVHPFFSVDFGGAFEFKLPLGGDQLERRLPNNLLW